MAVAVKGTANTNAGTTVTIPTHAVGDLIIIGAYKTSVTAPTKPSASGTVPAWVTIGTSSGNTNSWITAYFVATASNHTSGTWTGAGQMFAVVCTGQSPTVVGGAAGGTNTSNLTVTGHTITLTQADGSSLVLDFWARTATVTAWNAVSGFTDLATTTGTAGLALSSKNDSTSVSAQSRVSTGTATVGSNEQFEIVSGPHPTDSVTTSESLGTPSQPILYTPVTVSESVNVVISGGVADLTVNVSDSTSLTDTPTLQVTRQTSVSDSTSTTDTVTVSLVAAGTLTVNVSDSTSTTETVSAKLSDAAVSVSDIVSTTNVPTLQCPSPLSVTDSTSVSESVTVSPPSSIPTISVSDSTITSEWIVIAFDPPIIFTLEVSVSDSASTSESVALQCPSPLSVSDSTSTSETVKTLLIGNVSVSDSTATSESLALQCPSPLNVSDSTSVSESVAASLLSFVNVTDSTATGESVTVSLQPAGAKTINVTDSVATSETVNATLPGSLQVTVSDSTTTTEFASAQFPGTFGPPPRICDPTIATLVLYTSRSTVKAYASSLAVVAYTSTAKVQAYTSSVAVKPYASSVKTTSYTSAAAPQIYRSFATPVPYTSTAAPKQCSP